MNHAQKWIEHCFGQIAVVVSLGPNTDVFADGSRTRIVRGHEQYAIAVADWTRLRPVGRTLRAVFQPLREYCVGNWLDDSPDAVRSVNWTLRVRQTNCFADSSGNCPDASRLLRQPLCGHSPVMREMFPGNRPDTARLQPGECPDASSDVGRMSHGHCAGTDWPRTGHGLDAAADIVPDIRQHRLGCDPSIAQTLAEYYPGIARMIHRMLRGPCAACSLTFV